jgi:hypothetical protein
MEYVEYVEECVENNMWTLEGEGYSGLEKIM